MRIVIFIKKCFKPNFLLSNMRNNSFFKIVFLAITTVFLASCDKDFNSIGGDLIGDEHFGLEHKYYDVLSYNQKLGSVQSNNLPVNPLGVYEDAVFGTTEASFVTQLVFPDKAENPVIDLSLNPKIDNVLLSIPYFSHIDYDAVNAVAGDNTYILDSIYGSATGKIKLSIYESGYFMRDLDPDAGFLESQKYYTNQGGDFDGLIVSSKLNDSINTPSQNDEFFFDPNEIRKKTTDENGVETTTRSAPAMRIALDTTYFRTKIIDAAKKVNGSEAGVDPGKLTTNDVFKNYFRGLYFKVEKSGSNSGQLAMMNFKAGTVTINYKEDYKYTEKDANGNDVSKTKRVLKSIVLNMTGNTVSLLSNANTTAYANAIDPLNVNKLSGDETLYVKGGEGSMAVLELFDKTDVRGYDSKGNPTMGDNGVPDELDDLRNPSDKKRLLINEANLVFHMDKDKMGSNKKPKRIYLYDLTNSTNVLDYLYDGTTGANAKSGLLIYSGILNTTNSDDNTYKVRITNHIKSLVKYSDSTNVKLGVVVTESINNSAMNKLRTSFTLTDGKEITKAPQASVMSPLGVVLHGGAPDVPDDKRIKLEIYYTKPN